MKLKDKLKDNLKKLKDKLNKLKKNFFKIKNISKKINKIKQINNKYNLKVMFVLNQIKLKKKKITNNNIKNIIIKHFIDKFIKILEKKQTIDVVYFKTFINYLEMYYRLYKKGNYRKNIKNYVFAFKKKIPPKTLQASPIVSKATPLVPDEVAKAPPIGSKVPQVPTKEPTVPQVLPKALQVLPTVPQVLPKAHTERHVEFGDTLEKVRVRLPNNNYPREQWTEYDALGRHSKSQPDKWFIKTINNMPYENYIPYYDIRKSSDKNFPSVPQVLPKAHTERHVEFGDTLEKVWVRLPNNNYPREQWTVYNALGRHSKSQSDKWFIKTINDLPYEKYIPYYDVRKSSDKNFPLVPEVLPKAPIVPKSTPKEPKAHTERHVDFGETLEKVWVRLPQEQHPRDLWTGYNALGRPSKSQPDKWFIKTINNMPYENYIPYYDVRKFSDKNFPLVPQVLPKAPILPKSTPKEPTVPQVLPKAHTERHVDFGETLEKVWVRLPQEQQPRDLWPVHIAFGRPSKSRPDEWFIKIKDMQYEGYVPNYDVKNYDAKNIEKSKKKNFPLVSQAPLKAVPRVVPKVLYIGPHSLPVTLYMITPEENKQYKVEKKDLIFDFTNPDFVQLHCISIYVTENIITYYFGYKRTINIDLLKKFTNTLNSVYQHIDIHKIKKIHVSEEYYYITLNVSLKKNDLYLLMGQKLLNPSPFHNSIPFKLIISTFFIKHFELLMKNQSKLGDLVKYTSEVFLDYFYENIKVIVKAENSKITYEFFSNKYNNIYFLNLILHKCIDINKIHKKDTRVSISLSHTDLLKILDNKFISILCLLTLKKNIIMVKDYSKLIKTLDYNDIVPIIDKKLLSVNINPPQYIIFHNSKDKPWFTDYFKISERDAIKQVSFSLKFIISDEPDYIFKKKLNNLLFKCNLKDISFKLKDIEYKIGNFSCLSLTELKNLQTFKEPTNINRILSEIEINSNISDLILTCDENENNVFQAASQFNLLEMYNQTVIPEEGIEIYSKDNTQGPRVALSSPANTFFRNYLIFARQKQIQDTRQSKDNQVNTMQEVLDNIPNIEYKYQNGYLFIDTDKINTSIDFIQLMEQYLRVGVHTNSPLINGKIASQVFCSGLPIIQGRQTQKPDKNYYYGNSPILRKLATSILEAAIKCTFQVGVNQLSVDKPYATIYLTYLGCGEFGNDIKWFRDAYRKAVDAYQYYPLIVKLVRYSK